MCGGGSAPDPDPVKKPQVLRNRLLDGLAPGTAGSILRAGRGSLRIDLGSGDSPRQKNGAIGTVAGGNLIPAGGSQGSGRFITPTYGLSDQKKAKQIRYEGSQAYRDEQMAAAKAKKLAQQNNRK